jgi:hypothetical protein
LNEVLVIIPIKFYAETHIARPITDQLKARGVDVIRAEEVGMAMLRMRRCLSTQRLRGA